MEQSLGTVLGGNLLIAGQMDGISRENCLAGYLFMSLFFCLQIQFKSVALMKESVRDRLKLCRSAMNSMSIKHC